MVYNAKIISWQQIFYKGWKYHENSRSLVDSLATEPGLKLQGAGEGKNFQNPTVYFLTRTTCMKNCLFSHRPKSSFIHCASLT